MPDIPWLDRIQNSGVAGQAIVAGLAGLAPAAISSTISFLLPIIMRSVGKWSGAYHRGQLDKDVIKQLYLFLLVRFILTSHSDTI